MGNNNTEERSYSLDEDIGTMLLVGFRGTEINKDNHIVRDIQEYHVGAVILFDYDVKSGKRGRNISSKQQVKELCGQLKELNPNLLIGIDQEGGYVARLSTRYGFEKTLSAKRSAMLGMDSVRSNARLTARMLKEVGINLNFAPVVDIDVNPKCPVIGGVERSFSNRRDIVVECARVWIEEQERGQVVSCLKHFPGHGSANGDTHLGLVEVSETWTEDELKVYEDILKNSKDTTGKNIMVMTAHVINRQLDSTGLPASLSKRMTQILREDIGFEGVIITDDLGMGAIAKQYSLQQTVRMALMAGADMLCLGNNGGGVYDEDMVPKVVEIIKNMVAEGEISEEQIRTSAERIRRLQRQR